MLRPLLMTRIANTVPGLALATLSWPLAGQVPPSEQFACLAPAAVGAVLAARGYRMAVMVTGSHVTVRGLLLSRTIRRADIVELTSLPALRWRRSSGHHVDTPLLMFMQLGRLLPVVEAHNDACLDRLARALDRRR